MKRALFGLMAVIGSMWALPASAQSLIPVSVEARGGFDFPMGDLSDVYDADSGYGWGASASFNLIPAFGVYAGWDRHVFPATFPGTVAGDGDLIDSGFQVGGEIGVPVAIGGLAPWLRAGAIFHTADFDFDEPIQDFAEGDVQSDRATGFEAQAGVTIPLGMVVSFTPRVLYRTYDPNYKNATVPEGKISYWGIEMGLRFGF